MRGIKNPRNNILVNNNKDRLHNTDPLDSMMEPSALS
jgi:hypothetical protein